MYLRTDDDHNIVEAILIGGMPEKNGFEVNANDIPEDVLKHLLEYKYIDGEFIKQETRDEMQANIETVRSMKIEWLSSVCHELIEKGINIDGHRYSLTGNDQLELLRLESIAKLSPLTPVFYHADGEKYRSYTTKEFLNIASKAIAWITYHRTYFNLLKSEVLEMTVADDIAKINYGAPLNNSNRDLLNSILPSSVTPTVVVVDEFDYESMFSKTNTARMEDFINRMERINSMSNEEVTSELENILGGGDT